MKLFAKRALLLTVLVLCLFGISVLAASADTYADDAAAITGGAVARVGDETTGTYYADLATAVTEAASGSTITVLQNASFGTATTINGKTLTIKGTSADVVLTTSAAFTLTNDATLSVSDITLNSSATFIKTSTATNGNSFSLENVDLHVSAMTANVGFINPTSKIAIEITGVDITATVGKNSSNKDYAVWIIHVGANGTVAPLSIANTTTTTALVRVESSTAVVGTADAPATLTDITQTAGCPLYCYGGTIYANIFGGSFSGALCYGGDNATNTLDIKINPTGDKTTTFTRAGTSSSLYSAWVHLNPSAVKDVSFTLRNLIFSDTGAAPLFALRAASNYSIYIENSTFSLTGAKLSGLPEATGVHFESDDWAQTFGLQHRVGAAGGRYYLTVGGAATADPSGDVYNFVTDKILLSRGTLADDDAAVAAGYSARVGDLSDKVYTTTLKDAIGAAPNGGTVYVLKSTTLANVTLTGKAITIEGVGDVTVDGSGSTTALFTLASSASVNSSLTLKNLTITLGAKNLVLANSKVVNDGAYTVVAEGLTVTANADKTIFHLNSTAANLDVIDNGSTYTAQYLFYISNAGALDFDLTGTTIRATIYRSAEDASGTGGTLGSATDPVTLTDVILEPNNGVASGGFAFRRSTPAFIEVYGGRFNLRSVAYNAAYTDDEAIGAAFIGSRDGYAPVIDVKIAKSATSGTEFHLVGWATNYKYYTNVVSMNGSGAEPTITFEASDASFKSYSNRCFLFAVWGTGIGNFDFTDCSFDNANGPGIFYFGTTAAATLSSSKLVSGTRGSDNLTFVNEASALDFGMTIRAGEIAGGKAGVVYFSDLYDALTAAPTDNGNGEATNVYVLVSTTQRQCLGVDGTPFAKKVNVIGVGTTAPVITNDNYWLYLGDGAEVSYSNVTLQANNRFARGDGDFTLTFGNKCTVNNSSDIFFWDKGDGGAATYTFDIQAGAVLNVTGNLNNAIFYDNASDSNGAALAGTKVTIKIAGTINTTNKPVAKDVNSNGTYTIYCYSGAVINTGTSALVAREGASGYSARIFAKGFASTEAAAAWGYSIGATAMTYSADPSKEWNYMFVNHGSMTYSQWENYLNSYGGEMWQLVSTTNIWWTHNLNNFGTVTMKSYNGATITGPDASYRIQLTNTTLILDGITIYGNPATIQLNAGTAAAPSALKLINGAKIICNTADSLAKLIKVNGACAVISIDETSNIAQSGAESTRITEAQLIAWGFTMREDSLNAYHNRLETAIAAIPNGSEATINILAPAIFGSPITLENKKVTIVGMDETIGDATYDLTYTGGDYMFDIYNLADLTFQNVNFKTGRPLIKYYSTALTTVAQDDKDITVSFINSYLDYNGSSRFIVSTNNGDSAAGTQCDTFTFNVDEKSTVSWVANSTDPRYMFYFNHGSHKYIVLNVAGTVSFKDHVTGVTNEAIFFTSNNPSGATVTFTETAHLIVDIADPIAADRIFYFKTGANKLTIHEKALFDEEGNLTLSGMRLFRQFSAGAAPATVIVADSVANEAAWLGLIGEDEETNAFSIIKYRAIADGTYYYTNTLSAAVERVNGSQGTAELYLFKNDSVSKGVVLDGVTFSLTGAEGVTLTSSATRLFKLTNGASLTITDLAITGTASTSSAATAGSILAFDDAEATAKSTATLTNVTLTANSSIPFYFGGVSVAELNIVGGTYSGMGMISFGYVASADTDTYFDGVANVTITGTAENHASLSTVSGGGDSASLIFVNSSKSVKDNVKVTLNYADLTADGHATYLRNQGTLTMAYSNGNLSSSYWVISSQSSAVPYVTFTNVTITGTSADHIMRPYAAAAGAYVKFIGGSITANNVTNEGKADKDKTPILNFNNANMTVSFDGVTFNSTSTVGLLGTITTCPTITAKDCAFNLTGPILYQSNTALPVMLKGNTTVNSTAMGDENASTYGFSAKVLVGEEAYYVPLLNSFALSLIPTGGTGSIKLLAQHTLSAEISFQDKSVTLIGADAVVDDTNYDLIYTGTDNTFRIYDVGTLTLQNMNVKTGGTFFRWDSSKYSAKATADKNITLALVDTYVTVESTTASYFVGSVSSNDDNHLACNTFTLEMDDGSAVDFTSSASKNSDTSYGNHSFNFIYGNDTSHPYIAANIHGQVDISFTNEAATPFLFIRENNVSGINLNVTDTAKLKIALADPTAATTAYLAACWTGATSRNIITIALSAITENGALTLGDVSLYVASAGCEPQVCIIAGDTTLQAALLAWEKLISYRVDYDGKYHYYTLLDNAKDAADANVTVVVYLRTLPDVEAAVEVGAIFRLGDATDQGVMGQHYFTKIADLIEYAATQSMTDITVYVLTSGKTDSSAITLTGIKMTLTSYGSKQTLTLSGAPAFKLDADSHLVVDNVKIEVTNAFAQVVNADTAKYTKLDLEAGAYVDLKAATANGSKYFLIIANVTNTGILTVNVKQGAVINATANATGGTQGLFQISATRDNAKVAVGSSINVNGEINFSQNYTSTGYAPIFMVNNPNLVININDGATVTLGHTGTTGKSVWHAIFCFDDKATVNIGNATLRANADGALFGINGAGCGAVLTVTGATFTAENFPMGVIDGWTEDTSSYNTQKVTFNNCTFTGNVASHSRMTGIVLNNATFNSLAHAQANFASLRVGSSDTTGYYSKFAGAIEATSDGGTLWVIADMSDSDVSIINKSLTIQGISANDRPLITNSSDGSTRIFTCKGNVVLTLKDLEINAKARLVWFGCETYVETVDDVETTQFIDVTASGLSLYNVDAYGVAVGANHNDMIGVGDNKGHHNFDLYIDETSSVGYLDGDPATIRSTRDYQVIFYYASVTGDIVIEGDVFAYVYFTGNQVNYAKVIANNPAGSWAANAPNSQHMIQIGSGGHTFMGDIIIKGNLTHKVVFPSVDENGNRVYPEDYPTLHSAYAIYVSGASAGVFVADGAKITLDYENEYQPKTKAICFAGSAADYETTCDDGATAGRYHYYGVGALIAFLNNNAYKNNRLTVATPSGSSYGIVYDASTFISTTVEEDTGIAGSGGHDYYGANEIAALLSRLTGATVNATKDDTSSTYEIIVGIANRELVETYLPQLEMNEYAIIMKDNKILILAWHDAALNKGVAAFKYALQACADGTTVYLPALDGIYKGVANESWITNFTKPANGTLWGGQYVNDNSLQYVYNGYADAQAGHEALNAYCAVLESEGYTLVWQNVIENNLFRMYQNTESGIALYVAYNDYTYKDKYYGTNGLYAQDEALLESEFNAEADFNDDYFEHRDHQKVLRVVSMPLSSVTLPDDGILQLDMSYDKVDNTAMTTLSFQSTSVGLGHVYMLEDGRFLVVDGGGAGFTSEGDVTEPEAIWQVMNKMYENAYGKTPEENGDVIHIAAWYLTHAHWDHYTAFTKMLQAHGANMQMDYMIGNFMASDSTYRNHATSFNPASYQQYVNGGFKFVKVYTGQRVYFANIEIEVLMTYMDHAPFDIINSNDSNTVTRFSIHNKDAMNGVTAQVLYLGDSWRHSSRILCEMYDGYLQTEIVQLAHHGNIGCERVLYKAVAPRAVLFSHNGSSFQSYVYFSNIVTNENVTNAHKTVAFRYGANVWCAANAEYVWSAPYGTYNVLEFLPARPDYENVHELGIQPSATAGTTPSYDTSYDREIAIRYNYIHNASNGYKSVNVVWGDFSFSYEGGSAGIWSPETLRYESANDGEWVANGNNKIWVGNASTGNDQSVNVQLSFTAAEGYTNFTGTFKQNGEVVAQNTNVALASKEYKEFEFFLDTTSLPGESLDDQVIGSITVTLK